jgi:hypothetical protein
MAGLKEMRERRRSEATIKMAAAGGKKCRKCHKTVPVNMFASRAASADGLDSWCRGCQRALRTEQSEDPEFRRRRCDSAKKAYAKAPEKARKRALRFRLENPEKAKEIWARHRAQARVAAWASQLARSCNRGRMVSRFGRASIDAEFIKTLFKKQGGRCYWLGIPMVPSPEHRDPRRPSLDRLDNEIGYVPGNVVLTTMFANMGRSQLSAAAFAVFVSELQAHIRHPTC